jgi:hypothetical protein
MVNILKVEGGGLCFQIQARFALLKLRSEPAGRDLVRNLRESDNTFVLTNKLDPIRAALGELYNKPYNSASADNWDNARNGVGTGGVARVSLKDSELSTREGMLMAPLFLRIGHELSHLLDFDRGVDIADDTKGLGGVPASEKSAVQRENWIRQEHGIPERDKY